MPHNNNSPIRIENDTIRFGEDGVEVRFMRTLRIPDDGKKYPLPPGFGSFPIKRVQDYMDKVPVEWRERGGVFLPMYQREAMWLSFSCPSWKPRALQIGVGKVCAVTGSEWTGRLSDDEQNYVVLPKQPWLDGIATGKGTIRQFVAMPLGMGYTVEGQITGSEEFGGVQLQVHEPKIGRFQKPVASRGGRMRSESLSCCYAPPPQAASMGLAAGGRMEQKIYRDSYGIDTWDPQQTSRVFVHLVSSHMWREITGEEAPPSPITTREYEERGLPWYELYDSDMAAVAGSSKLQGVKSVAKKDVEKFGQPIDNSNVGSIKKVTGYAIKDPNGIYDGNW